MRNLTLREPVIFSQVVEALFNQSVRGSLDVEMRKRLKVIGIDLDKPLLAAYSASTWFAAIAVCAEVFQPGVSNEQARYRLGREVALNYGRTTLGKAVYLMLRMIGWENALRRIPRGLQSGTNFLSAHTRFLEEGILEVVFEVLPDFHADFGSRPGIDPHFMQGNMDAMMSLVGAPFQDGELQPITPGSQRVVYLLRPKKRAGSV